MLGIEWQHKTEPFSNEELAAMGRIDLSTDHEEVEETISQFEACVQEILYMDAYKETVHE